MIFIITLISVYFLAVNFYAFTLMRLQKTQAVSNENPRRKITDKKIFLSGALGGALGVYLATFILKYRRDSLFIMVLMPILIALTILLIVTAFKFRVLIR